MSLLAALFLAAASARVESVSLTTLDSRLAVRVLLSGTPGLVAVHREGDVARVSIMDADLGLRFAGGRRFSWTPSDGFDPALLAATPAKLDRLEVAAGPSEVSVLLHVPPEVSVDVRRDTRGLLLVFRSAGMPAEPARVARAVPETAPVTPAPDVAVCGGGPGAGRRRPASGHARARAGGARSRGAARPATRRRRGRASRSAAVSRPCGRNGGSGQAPLPHRARRRPGRHDRGRVRAVPASVPGRRAPGAA